MINSYTILGSVDSKDKTIKLLSDHMLPKKHRNVISCLCWTKSCSAYWKSIVALTFAILSLVKYKIHHQHIFNLLPQFWIGVDELGMSVIGRILPPCVTSTYSDNSLLCGWGQTSVVTMEIWRLSLPGLGVKAISTTPPSSELLVICHRGPVSETCHGERWKGPCTLQ